MILTSSHKMVTAKKSMEINSFRRFLQRKGKKIPFCQEQIQTIQEFLGAWAGFVCLLLLLIHSHRKSFVPLTIEFATKSAP